MKTKSKNVIFTFSLVFNALFVILIIMASNVNASRLSFLAPDAELITAAAVVSFPADSRASFELIEISLKPRDKAYLQFSFVVDKQQGNLLMNALYDHGVISVSQTGFGIEITALAEGETLMQTLADDGVKNIALIKVE